MMLVEKHTDKPAIPWSRTRARAGNRRGDGCGTRESAKGGKKADGEVEGLRPFMAP